MVAKQGVLVVCFDLRICFGVYIAAAEFFWFPFVIYTHLQQIEVFGSFIFFSSERWYNSLRKERGKRALHLYLESFLLKAHTQFLGDQLCYSMKCQIVLIIFSSISIWLLANETVTTLIERLRNVNFLKTAFVKKIVCCL